MNNFIQPGKNLTVTAPAALTSGDPVMIGGVLFGVAAKTVASGAAVEIATEGVYSLPKDTALAISIGDRLFWDSGNSWLDKTAAAQVCVGIAVSAQASADTTVRVKLGAVTPAGT